MSANQQSTIRNLKSEIVMKVKDSSDEFNSSSTLATRSTKPKSLTDYLALAIATCGVGYLPLAPGTWGSLVGVAIYLLIRSSVASTSEFFTIESVLIIAVTFIGIWAASRTEKLSGRKDPGKVVVDEVAGQLIALLPILPGFDIGWPGILAAFLLFRLFDIIKPFPARRFERFKAGMGIMCDDLVAGVYAAVGTAIIIELVHWLH